MTRHTWMLVLVCLDIELILTQDRCTVCTEHTIGLEIILDTPDGSPR
jgi:predicted RNA-binding protein with PUA domain